MQFESKYNNWYSVKKHLKVSFAKWRTHYHATFVLIHVLFDLQNDKAFPGIQQLSLINNDRSIIWANGMCASNLHRFDAPYDLVKGSASTIGRLVQERRSIIALELRLSCANPSIYTTYTHWYVIFQAVLASRFWFVWCVYLYYTEMFHLLRGNWDGIMAWKRLPQFWFLMDGIHQWVVDTPQINYAVIWCLSYFWYKQAVEPKVKVPVNWDAISLMSQG